jgi:uncharacterized protein (DUF362 family)
MGSQAISRRTFLQTLGAASATAAFSSCRNSPAVGLPEERAIVARASLGSYEYDPLRSTLERMFEQLGGLSDTIRPGDTVGIKINLTGGTQSAEPFEMKTGLHPGRTFWTHPEVLKVVGELVRDAGAGKLYVMEAIPDEECVGRWDYIDVSKEIGAIFVDLNQTAPYKGYSILPVGEKALIYETITENGLLGELDCLISLAKSKQHMGMGVTHGMKNLIGNLPIPAGLYNDGQWNRIAIHNNESGDGNTNSNLARITLDLVHATPIQLTVNDAIETVTGGEGPWHDALAPVRYNKIVAGKDVVAADAIATQAIKFDPTAADMTEPFSRGLNHLRVAEELGIGIHDPARITVRDATVLKG